MIERPSIGTRVRLLGHVGTVVAPPPPVVAGVPEEDPGRVWVAWDGSAISMLVDWEILTLEREQSSMFDAPAGGTSTASESDE